MTFFAGRRGDAWVVGAHGVGGIALAGVLGWKLRRGWGGPGPPAPRGRPPPGGGAAVAAGSYLVWELQRPVSALFGLRGARRRFTGSYESGSFAGNAFPSTSWVADSPPAAAARLLSPRRARAGRPPAAPPAGGASGPRHARGHTRLHRRLLLAPALDGRAPRARAGAGRPAARGEPRARDLPHRLPLELRLARCARAAACHRRRRRAALSRGPRAGAAGGGPP